jgi:glycosyltransferase involved in cell wall biosynthesis
MAVALPLTADEPATGHDPPAVEIVVPVFNEAGQLEASIRRLHRYLVDVFPFSFRLTIADNASTDQTWAIARELAEQLPGVVAVRLEEKGRGRALHSVWSQSDAEVLAYMDVDLSTDLAALLPLVAPLLSRHSDLAIGSRLARGAHVVRGPKRELISRSYNRLLHTALATRFSDAQCGFKAIRADRARQLLPLVKDRAWFFDTELLVLAERAGFRIHEVPVDWIDDEDSRVDLVATAADLRGVLRLFRDLGAGRIALPLLRGQAPSFAAQVLRFGAIGIASTAAYLLLYLAFRAVIPAQGANALALLTTAIANTAANRRITFAIRGRVRAVTHQAQGLLVFGLALGVTSGSLALLHAFAGRPAKAAEIAVLVAANLVATVMRFVLLRGWVFRERRTAPIAEDVS